MKQTFLALAVATLSLGGGSALAHDRLHLPATYDPTIQWLISPNVSASGPTRVRLIHHGQTRTALLNVSQTYAYQQAYNRHLTRLSRHMSVHRAIPRARHAAFHAVLRAYPDVAGDPILRPVTGGRIFIED